MLCADVVTKWGVDINFESTIWRERVEALNQDCQTDDFPAKSPIFAYWTVLAPKCLFCIKSLMHTASVPLLDTDLFYPILCIWESQIINQFMLLYRSHRKGSD